MKRKIKLILFHLIIMFLLVVFVVMSMTVFYLIPAGESVIDYLRSVIKDLIEIFKPFF